MTMKKRGLKKSIFLSVLFVCISILGGQLPSAVAADGNSPVQPDTFHLGGMFGDDMVLQRDMEAPIWGWASPGATVKVIRDSERPAVATAGADGKWMVRLVPLPAGGPHEIRVTSGSDSITLTNVLMGDVWICSGQSNMQWPVWTQTSRSAMYTEYPIKEKANAVYPRIRLYIVPMTTSFEPQPDIPLPERRMYSDAPKDVLRTWRECSPETVPPFSAVAYFFGRDLHRDLKLPIGLIQTSWGGSLCEAWTSGEALLDQPEFADTVTQLREDVADPGNLREEYEAAVSTWQDGVLQRDSGYDQNEAVWANPETDDSDWSDIDLPNVWETEGYPGLDGYVWFRKTVNLPKTWARKDLLLHLNAINDANETWFNGERISDFDYLPGLDTPRRYIVPQNAVKAGTNVIAVRVYDMGNQGGFMRSVGTMSLENPKRGRDAISLAGAWKMRVGVELKDLPPRPQEPLALSDSIHIPTVLYNAMIAPLIPYGIKGAIWYQGESNAGRAYQYRTLFPAMIADWRTRWGQGDFPFLFVQLANYQEMKNEPGEDAWAELREAQLMTLSQPNTGMAVTIDIGNAKDIHPKNKQDVGARLALAAQHVAYGEDLVYSGPIYDSMTIEGDRIRLKFAHTGSGLMARGGALSGFSIAGNDRKFVWAQAHIDGDTVVVRAPGIPHPEAVRYAWAVNPWCNLFNTEGLPASPFRTDDYPGLTVNNH
jgi:sialate O-acetylesterase